MRQEIKKFLKHFQSMLEPNNWGSCNKNINQTNNNSDYEMDTNGTEGSNSLALENLSS